MKRYARQIAIAGVGDRGQTRITSSGVTVEGAALDAEICALYLAGSGIGSLAVHVSLAERCRALNSEVAISIHETAGPCRVRLGDEVFEPAPDASELERGARAARWVLVRALEL